MSLKTIFLSGCMIVCSFLSLQGQWIHFGTNVGLDLYQLHRTPPANAIDLPSYTTGSALVNVQFGPKMWLGNGKMTFSLEALASYAPFAYDTDQYRGLGTLSFPLLASFNFNGLSSTSDLFERGFSFGGGVQFTNASLYFFSEEYGQIQKDFRPQYYPVFIGQVSYGGGGPGVSFYLYARYGYGPNHAATFSVGICRDINSTKVKSLKND